jgi:hypothetical protein
MKRLMIILSIFSLAVILGCANQKSEIPVYLPNENCKLICFGTGSEPDGFNGIKWGTNLSVLNGMKLYRMDPSNGGIEFYLKEGDTLKFGNGKPKTIQYGFWKEKFYVGMITTQGFEDWNSLKGSIFAKFGVGAKPFSNQEEYLWVGKNAVMAMKYDEISKLGTLYVRSDSMAKKMKLD